MAQLDGPLAFFTSIPFLRPARTRCTLELLAAVFRAAQFVEMRFKHALACRRPMEYSPQIQPMILTPGHGSLPSGHSTESFAMARTLIELLKKSIPQPPLAATNPGYGDDAYGVQLMRLAARVAINRHVAGVHFPVDSAAGALLGLTLAGYLLQRFQNHRTYQAWSFIGHLYPEDRDFHWGDLYDVAHNRQREPDDPWAKPIDDGDPDQLGAPSPILNWLWEKARAEWR